MIKINQTKGFLLVRTWFTVISTIGKLYYDGEFICYILENPYLGNRKNISCIPKGIYDWVVRFDKGSKYKYPHIHIINVINRNWILMHIGNWARDTLGCMLPGLTREKDFVGDSATAFNRVMKKITNIKKGKFQICDWFEAE